MAGNGKSKVVSNSSESVSELSFAADTTSLQELIESELAMRDPANKINKSNSVSNNVVCSDSVNNINVPNSRNLAHDSSPSSKFEEIFRETFKEDSDVEDAYTNTPEILSLQLTSSTELLDMSYSMKFEKLTQPETYNQQIIDPLAHQINRDDVEADSLDHCQEIIRLKGSIKNAPDLSNGDLVNHTNGSNDYEEINYDPQVKLKNAYNEKFHNEDADLVEYEEISKFHVNQTNMFIENEIYYNGREKCFGEDSSSDIVNGVETDDSDVVDKATTVTNGVSSETSEHFNYENVKVENGVSSVEKTESDPFESLSERPSDPVIVTSATNYNVKLLSPSTENMYANEDREEDIYEEMEGKLKTETESPEEQGVDFDEFDPTVTNVTSVSSKPNFVPPFPPVRSVEEPSTKPNNDLTKSPQIIGVSSKSKFVEPTEQLVFESWSTPYDEGEGSRIQIIEKSESSPEQEDHSSQEVLTESFESSEKKTAKKKKNGVLEETHTVTTSKTKKSKKSKKSDEKENHISVVTTSRMEEDDLSNVCVRDLKQTFAKDVPRKRHVTTEEPVPASVPIKELKSSFSKFDELSKKALASSMTDVPRSLQNGGGSTADVSGLGAASPPPALCKSCGKNVFVMEQIKAEKQTWHKNCFRCQECNKQLTLDIYSSHEGVLYCKPHFRELFKPKAVVESQDPEPSSDKPDLGLEELSSLNVKSRYQVFEKSSEEKSSAGSVAPPVKRSPSILSKVAKFQAKGGLSAGVSDENLNGVHYEESESSAESEDEQDGDLTREKIIKNRKKRERPLSFSKMSDVKKTWENGPMTKEERLEERKIEKQNLRSRLFMGKQGRMKEMYEQAVADSEKGVKREIDIHTTEKARNVRDKFERGEVQGEEEGEGRKGSAIDEDFGVFEAGISKKSRSLFLELDANAAAAKSVSSPPPPHSTSPRSPRFDEARRASRESDSPEREVYRDPNVVRADDVNEDDSSLIVKSATASKMLSIFRQMEEAATKEVIPDGPKPLKSFTPPPDYKGHTGDTASEDEESSEEEEEEEESEAEQGGGDIVRGSYKVEDEFLKQAQNAARAKSLAAKFEHWEPEKLSGNNAISMLDSEQASLDSTKSLRARFESLNSTNETADKPKPKVNRFVMQPESPANGNANPSSLCFACNKKVYPLEKIETDGRLFHRACFRCTQCCTVLRMESYTMNNGHLYCLPHFKQLFISRGNYDEGFGNDQHKRKWQPVATAN